MRQIGLAVLQYETQFRSSHMVRECKRRQDWRMEFRLGPFLVAGSHIVRRRRGRRS